MVDLFSNLSRESVMINKSVLVLCFAVLLGIAGCSRQQSDWEKTRTTNTIDAYEQFLKSYPSGEFTAQAQARVKELYEERDWQKARDADTLDAYQAFLKQYPEGKWTEEARIRVENFTLASAPGGAPGTTPPGTPPPGSTPGAAQSGTTPNPASTPASPASPPATTPTPASPAPTATATNPGKAGSGSYGIQLGAYKSGSAAADKRWAQLTQKYPKLLAGLKPKVAPKKSAAGTVYRLQVVHLSRHQADSLCSALKKHSEACTLLKPQKA
jgi:cell division septation protein DedD